MANPAVLFVFSVLPSFFGAPKWAAGFFRFGFPLKPPRTRGGPLKRKGEPPKSCLEAQDTPYFLAARGQEDLREAKLSRAEARNHRRIERIP